ncbi:DUF6126 family protein [Streptomyces sp. NPDC003077]|uniref:DUF6126 family protein n=1 Tax=Streptomyces sp. NPDC003077 TaxID=3154443 RepID=UPI0033A4158A
MPDEPIPPASSSASSSDSSTPADPSAPASAPKPENSTAQNSTAQNISAQNTSAQNTSAAPSAPGSTEAPGDGAARPRTYVENKPPLGVYVRVFIYVVATHVLLGFFYFIMVMAKSR